MSDRLPSSGLVLNVRKPIGWTSNDVVRFVKHRTNAKVGHAGTLDPFADGVLLVCLGAATKQVTHLMGLVKEYDATLQLGLETDTLDITGTVTGTMSDISISLQNVEKIIPQFIGDIEQTPPLFSALRVKGMRAYQLARQNKKVSLERRRVKIQSINLLSIENTVVRVRVICSKGTYIRSLARDMAHALGTIGFLRTLTRTRVGDFTIETADSLTRIEKRLGTTKI